MTLRNSTRTDTLYLLDPEFADAARDPALQFCPDCMIVEGLIRAFPARAAALDVVRVPFARPRVEVIARVGEAHQNLPLLVFGDGGGGLADGRAADGTAFAAGLDALLAALHHRHGFPMAR